MLETMAGIWIFLLTAGAGFVCGRYARSIRRHEKRAQRAEKATSENFGWQELLNFLQYDGSGEPLTGSNTERTENSENYTGTDTGRVQARRTL